MSLINTQVQPFKANAYKNGQFIEVTEASLKGHWSVLIFMPAAFTFNCPTEIEDAAEHYAEFQKAGAEVYIVTTDTHFSHKVWHETSPAVGKAQFPLIGDPTHQLTNAFGVHIPEEGLALRGTFIINPEGVIKTLEIHDNAIARALVTRPALLLADEPTGNLDTRTAESVFALFRRFNREFGCAVLVVTHDPRLAAQCARTVELVDGRIVRDAANTAAK